MLVHTTKRWLRPAKVAVGLLLVIVATQHFYTLYQPNALGANFPFAPTGVPLSGAQAHAVKKSENLLAEVKAVTRGVFENTEHCEVSDLRLSWLENTILALNPFSNIFQQGVLVRERFHCGYCHQRSFILLEILQERFERSGAVAHMQGLNGHVVLQFEVGGRTFLTDPDYGVGPFEYHREDSVLSTEVTKAYAGIPNLNQMLSMYLSRKDNLAYSSTDSFNIIKLKQLWWFRISSVVGAFLIFFSCILIWSSLRR